MKLDPDQIQTGNASYAPEDNKLRLYVGRVPRPEFDALRAEGWTCTPKQSCDFVATWTPERRDTALAYGNGVIEDEDQPMAERAADRAERFGGYRDKRTDEATGHADRYDAGPQAHGYQSQARAERAAARHDRIADRSCDAWSKAEYWQRRTAGVISHALHKSRPDVRMGRIKEIESHLRKIVKSREEYTAKHNFWREVAAMDNAEKQNALALRMAYVEHGDYTHPRTGRKSYLYDHGKCEEGRNTDALTGAELAALWLSENPAPRTVPGDWETHYNLRLAYENQMLEAQGGRAAFVEMIPGGWLGDRQIQKVNKSPATGRVVSVLVQDNHASTHNRWGNPFPDGVARVLSHTIETERLSMDAYRNPTPEELAAFNEKQKKAKAKAKIARAEVAIPLINPTDVDAERLQALWNKQSQEGFRDRIFRQYGQGQTWIDYIEKSWKPSTICRITQATYSANSKGAHAKAETREMGADCELQSNRYNANKITTHCKLRTTWGDGEASGYPARRVIVITDKPQKPLPAAVWAKAQSEQVAA